MYLYKGGETSPYIHPVDASAWYALGWSAQPTSETRDRTLDSVISELQASHDNNGWQALRERAQEVGYLKPTALSWFDSIPDLAQAILGNQKAGQ